MSVLVTPPVIALECPEIDAAMGWATVPIPATESSVLCDQSELVCAGARTTTEEAEGCTGKPLNAEDLRLAKILEDLFFPPIPSTLNTDNGCAENEIDAGLRQSAGPTSPELTLPSPRLTEQRDPRTFIAPVSPPTPPKDADTSQQQSIYYDDSVGQSFVPHVIDNMPPSFPTEPLFATKLADPFLRTPWGVPSISQRRFQSSIQAAQSFYPTPTPSPHLPVLPVTSRKKRLREEPEDDQEDSPAAFVALLPNSVVTEQLFAPTQMPQYIACQWGTCGQPISPTRSGLQEHLRLVHHIKCDNTSVYCQWGGCGQPRQCRSLAQHLGSMSHLGSLAGRCRLCTAVVARDAIMRRHLVGCKAIANKMTRTMVLAHFRIPLPQPRTFDLAPVAKRQRKQTPLGWWDAQAQALNTQDAFPVFV